MNVKARLLFSGRANINNKKQNFTLICPVEDKSQNGNKKTNGKSNRHKVLKVVYLLLHSLEILFVMVKISPFLQRIERRLTSLKHNLISAVPKRNFHPPAFFMVFSLVLSVHPCAGYFAAFAI